MSKVESVKVAVRVRPYNDREKDAGSKCIIRARVRGGTSGPGERTWQLYVASVASSRRAARHAAASVATLARHCSSPS